MAIETLFLSIFDLRSSIIDSVFDCRLPYVDFQLKFRLHVHVGDNAIHIIHYCYFSGVSATEVPTYYSSALGSFR